ncbi:MAG: hypothetical protein AB8G05_12075 [Oligoflexales bacterium]
MEHKSVELINPGSFDQESHYYTKVVNAQPHPMVSYFRGLRTDQIINRYCHLKPNVDSQALSDCIFYKPKYFKWAGVDLFHVATPTGNRHMIVVETNSCPSGQKSMPQFSFEDEKGCYKHLIKRTFLPFLRGKADGKIAVFYDKNYMEASGYAASIADETNETVLLVPFYNDEQDYIKLEHGFYQVCWNQEWIPIKAVFRYVTQKPWNRIPIKTKTKILNPIISCLAGGRNKIVAAKAYELFNASLEGTGLKIHTPETICDVGIHEIPFWLKRFGGHAVVKVPYANAGHGVFTITNKGELDAFMDQDLKYEQFIVQSLIGNSSWSSDTQKGKFYHVGTVPNKSNRIYAADLRMMGCYGDEGFKPLSLYGRRARLPLPRTLDDALDSWAVLGTNLSIKKGDNHWESDCSRLILTDYKEFNMLGLSFDELIEGYVQLVLAVNAIDRMAINLINKKGELKTKLFKSFDNDKQLLKEIEDGNRDSL